MVWRLATGALLLLALVGAEARADENLELRKARALLEQLEYEKANASLEAALRLGTNGPEELKEIYRLRGQVNAVLGHAKASQDAFRRMLAIDPDARLPVGVAKKISKPYDAARATTKERGVLEVRHEVSAKTQPVVTLVVESDPLEMVAGARVTYRVGDAPWTTTEVAGKDRIPVTLEGRGRIETVVVAVDEDGNRLVELGTRAVPISFESPEPPPVPPPSHRSARATPSPPVPIHEEEPPPPWYARASLWTGVATIGMTGLAISLSLEARAKTADLRDLTSAAYEHSYREAQALEDDTRRTVLFTNVAFGAAGALALTTTVLWILETRSSGGARRGTVALVPVGDGLGFSTQWSYQWP